ncbi:hypothetical protein [Arcobacter sp. CECT 8985]|uniref:hypothetical protein n=1 Tax=Arcobacter sp. CECT 8985 TaxID=1935424 RepID=UPI00100BDC52|nr:hypothetical protein [Arcobacter sp. CECT 8985]RXJ86398.1 hypothetical protein CRU93_08925 [Arcobacter sp. CECT 8985]
MEDNKQKLSDVKELIYKSFPKKLELDVKQVIKILPINKPVTNCLGVEISYIHEIGEQVELETELITINSRIYFDEPNLLKEERLTSQQKKILNCLYTRHSDGYVRQKRIENLLGLDDYFIIPFMISNAGSYLIEILNIINENINESNVKSYIEFIQENPSYWRLTKDRIVSYWNEFYRFKYNQFKDYVGSDFIKKLEDH